MWFDFISDSPDTSKSAEPVLQIGNEALDLYKEAINLLDGECLYYFCMFC